MRKALREGVLVLDGAMGTQLQHLIGNSVPELLNVTNPQAVQAVHARYLQAGSDMVLTNSFGGNAARLARFGLKDRLAELNTAAVQNAREAGARWVVGSVGPTGEMSAPLGSYTYEDFYQAFLPQVQALLAAGVDAIAIETVMDVIELKAAVGVVRDLAPDILLIAQVSLLGGRTLNGTDLPAVAVLLDALGVDVIGMNCVALSEELPKWLRAAAQVTTKPLIVQPNAGLPDQSGSHHLNIQEWRRIMRLVVETPGMGIVGGCCGTNPDAIRVLRELADEANTVRQQDRSAGQLVSAGAPAGVSPERTLLAGRTGVQVLGRGGGPYLIGERINPSGRSDLQEALRAGDWYRIAEEGLAQVEAGAVMLDVNVGLPGINQQQAMAEVVQQLQLLSPVPLVLDSPDPAVLEAGLRVYVGKAVINSCNASTASLQQVLPLARKYGAAVIGLCMDERGVPETAAGRVESGLKILREAERVGIPPADLLLDPLVLSAATGEGIAETLQTLAELRAQTGVRLVAGISNVSFGLPARERLNRVLLAMAAGAGLDFAIANPTDPGIVEALHAVRVILGRDQDCAGYLAHFRSGK